MPVDPSKTPRHCLKRAELKPVITHPLAGQKIKKKKKSSEAREQLRKHQNVPHPSSSMQCYDRGKGGGGGNFQEQAFTKECNLAMAQFF